MEHVADSHRGSVASWRSIGIAESIAATARTMNSDADVVAAEDAIDASDYDGIIIGSGVYANRWLSEATEAVRRLAPDLGRRPFWLYSCGLSGDPSQGAVPISSPVSLPSGLTPRGCQKFRGGLDRETLNRVERAAMLVIGAPYGDFRDWPAIGEWTSAILAELEVDAVSS